MKSIEKPIESQTQPKRPYCAPVLKRHGNVQELTQAEYGDLDRVVYGHLFAMGTPGMPDPPTR